MNGLPSIDKGQSKAALFECPAVPAEEAARSALPGLSAVLGTADFFCVFSERSNDVPLGVLFPPALLCGMEAAAR